MNVFAVYYLYFRDGCSSMYPNCLRCKIAVWVHAVSLFDDIKRSTNAIYRSVIFVDGLGIIALSFSNILSRVCIGTFLIVPGGI